MLEESNNDDRPNNSIEFDLRKQQDDFIRMLPIAKMVLGETPAAILQYCMKPHTVYEISESLNVHHQTVRMHLKNMTDSQVILRTKTRNKAGFLYQTQIAELNRVLAADSLGRQILTDQQLRSVYATGYEPNSLKLFRELPEPKESMRLKVGNITTTVWKFLVSNGQHLTRYTLTLRASSAAILHIWYRQFLYSHDGVSVTDLPGPTEEEVLQFLKETHKDILSYAAALKDLINSKALYGLNPDSEVWRLLGDFPVRYAQDYSQVFTQAWDEGQFGTIGIRRTVNDDYQQAFVAESQRYTEEFIKAQKEQDK